MFGKLFTAPAPQVVRKDNGETVVKVGMREHPVDPNAIAYDLDKYNRPVNAYYDPYTARIARFSRGYRLVAIREDWKHYIEELNTSNHRYARTARL